MVCKDTVRCQIVEAAKKRFSHYGYAKTTMAEVASDCSMSPGNLYRFFPGKLDIAEAIATEAAQSRKEELEKIVSKSNRSARARLRDYFFDELRSTYNKLESDPKVFEIALIISRERPEYVNRTLAEERKTLRKLLEEGNETGEFVVENPEFTAEMIQAATMKFRYPQLWSKLTLPKLERELEGVTALVVDGLSRRSTKETAAA